MSDPRPARRPVQAPDIAPPAPFVERRRTFRRVADRLAHEETRLLARALDVLAADHAPDERLAGILELLADTVGAHRAAVVADGPERRVAVSARDDAEVAAAQALGAWLDAAAPRSRARRAAAGPAPISITRPAAQAHRRARPTTRTPGGPWYAVLPIPSSGDVALGFEFAAPIDPDVLATRLPPALGRHAAVALALVGETVATERTLSTLRAGEEQRDRFVSTVAHELRTPLTGLSGYLDLILDGQVGDPAVEREFLERCRTIVGSMAGLVGDLLELSRLESGTLTLEPGAFSVAEALTTVASGLHPIALERGVTLHTDAPPRLRAATGDRRRVEQILTNLGANALKFAGDDGGRVDLGGRFEGTVAVLTVRDDGPGIKEEDRGRIFERFYRVAGNERVTGTGLGLPIARDLARAMSGDLDVASLRGAGSTFVLVLPGPAGASAPAIAEGLREAIAVETDRLRDGAILRQGLRGGGASPGGVGSSSDVGAAGDIGASSGSGTTATGGSNESSGGPRMMSTAQG